jgi:DNA-binding response OmpR family regulator
MISDDLRLDGHQKRVLDALETTDGRTLGWKEMEPAMYPVGDVPDEAVSVLKVTVWQLRKILTKANSTRRIDTVWGRGYRLGP